MIPHTIIIGAGLSGLIAAKRLQDAGFTVTVLDKARGVGGRMATRRVDGAIFDHGAQYFTARDARFVAQVQDWQAAGVVRPWARGFYTADGAFKASDEARYIGAAGMTAIPKHLAQTLDVRLEQRVVAVITSGGGWRVETEAGESFDGDALVLTPPVPQSLALLDAGAVALPDDPRAALDAITYHPCLALMARLDAPSRIEPPGGVWLDGEPLRWLADNHRKGISPVGYGVTLHAGPEFSREHWETDTEVVAQIMLDAAASWVGVGVTTTSVQRWRFSQPVHPYPEPGLYLAAPAPLVLAGDAFAGPRVEGAALSGMAAADRLIAALLP